SAPCMRPFRRHRARTPFVPSWIPGFLNKCLSAPLLFRVPCCTLHISLVPQSSPRIHYQSVFHQRPWPHCCSASPRLPWFKLENSTSAGDSRVTIPHQKPYVLRHFSTNIVTLPVNTSSMKYFFAHLRRREHWPATSLLHSALCNLHSAFFTLQF